MTVCIKFYKLQSTVHEDVYVNVLRCDCLSVQVVIAGLSVSVTVIESVKGCACQCMKIVKDLEYDFNNKLLIKMKYTSLSFQGCFKTHCLEICCSQIIISND